ncbi:transposase [Paenibacillus apiarius]|uniref:Transposase n=1 Tax=Paenibacillus apiarius TaxID=46240 RepID=A0ABT4DS14_9BACL|nr:transposase [Paenibacillus apiarius]MCY9514270.1 transposase [Paenibacillus apiarius]MCY9520147.1 transposase [Paenibacillus apiarius]MCY9550154.1 transposase [Paenibacillus apiarius]MCY9560235.1 transposase [Paenibacillus apiarius]MCY9683133.1 transposase [Paenibacillus apiarius]
MEAWKSVKTLAELQRFFPTETSCVPFLFQLKWPQGFVCPRCRHPYAYVIRTRRLPLYQCRVCSHQTSLTAGTVLEGSRTSLRKWITAFWLVSHTDADNGVNAVKLSAVIEVTYKTAWSMLHKIRAALSHGEADQLLEDDVNGFIAFYGRSYRSIADLHPREYPLIVAESITPEGQAMGVKMKLAERNHVAHKVLLRSARDRFIDHHVLRSCATVSIIRQPFRVHRGGRLYNTFIRARCWMNRTFHGIGITYLQKYLDEFCFRQNAASCPISMWDQLLHLCMSFSPATPPAPTTYRISHRAAA